MKHTARDHALLLRQQGTSYQEIMERVGVAKSTVWRWLKAGGLVEANPQQLTELKRLAQQKGAATVKAARLARTHAIVEAARQEIGMVSLRDLWMLGLALYWAEGAKQKPANVSVGVMFVNSDPTAIRLFLAWLRAMCQVT